MGGWQEVLSVAGTIVLMIAVFAAAYFVSKYVGRHYRPKYGSSKNITVMESTVIGKDRTLLLVKAGDKHLLVGATPNEFTTLCELDAEQLRFETAVYETTQTDFVSTFRDVLKGKFKKPDDGEQN